MTRPRTFTIATSGRPESGPRRWFHIRVYRTLDDLRRAANRRTPGSDFSEASAVCQPTPVQQHSVTNAIRYPANGFAGVIRLAVGHITSEIVTHELMHAACAVYRMNICRDVRLGRGYGGGDREESLAYIYGELYAATAAVLDPQP